MTLRATTNLVVPKHLQLPRSDMKKGFLYVYNKGYTGPEPVFIAKLWLSSVFPEVTNESSFGASNKNANKNLKGWASVAEKTMPAGLLSIKKINDAKDPHFEAAIPLARFDPRNLHGVATDYLFWFTDYKNPPDVQSADRFSESLSDSADVPEVRQLMIPAAQVIKNMKGLDAKGQAELKQCLLRIRIEYKGPMAVVFADFKITKDIAQQLTTTEWVQIRNIDLYPLLLQWVAGQYGYSVSAPLAAFPISKIARTLPPVLDGDARINENNISIDAKGLPYWLPRKLNNTERYEDLYAQVGEKGDGNFRLLETGHVADLVISGEDVKIKLPSNIPVLIDWVNNKYAYSLTTGMLKIQDLSRYKTADAAHIRNILNTTAINPKTIVQMANVAASAGLSDDGLTASLKFLPAELAEIDKDDAMMAARFRNGAMDFASYIGNAMKFAEDHMPNPALKEISTEGHAIFRPLARFLKKAHAAILANMDAVNARYSVSAVSSMMGYLTLIAKYGSEMATLNLEANKLCSAALSQGVEKGWTPPSVPLLSDKIGFLPHQIKVRNLLKDSPDFAILPVQAGGGKSVLTITDILYEIKADRSQPYLILCPAHLVAQYVKEIVFFTKSKLNVVAINTYTIRHSGFARLTKMLDNAPRNTVVVCNYDVLAKSPQQICYGTSSVTVYPIIDFLRQFRFGYAMLDESHCFLSGTLVDTPYGTRNIEDLVAGDVVLSALGPKVVEATHALDLNVDLVKLEYNGQSVTCTTKHPFFTQRGWVFAADLTLSDILVTQNYSERLLNEAVDLCDVREEICSEESENYKPKVLRDLLRSEVANEPTENLGENSHRSKSQEERGHVEETQLGKSRGCCNSQCESKQTYETQQSHVRSKDQGQDDAYSTQDGAHFFSEGRQWDRSEQVRAGGNEHVSKSCSTTSNSYENSTRAGFSDQLQSGFSVAETNGSVGGTGSVSFATGSRGLGREKEASPNFFRLASITRIKQSDYEATRGRQKVYNLQVGGHPSYSVNGALVHNSVKNDSQRTRACITLIADIPKKRLASGTMAHDSPSDLALQIGMLDPTLFGSREAFNSRYGEIVKGDRVISWKPGAQTAIMQVIQSRVVVAKAMRKEWAALLPEAEEKFLGVELTELQQQVYQSILEEALAKMREDAKGSKALQKFFEDAAASKSSDTDDEAESEAQDTSLEALLKFYLARLEQYLTAPAADELGNKLLKGDDRRSPKVNKIIERCYEHLNNNYPGKILIFTNYIESAETIYDAFPPDLKKKALLYVAADKEAAGSQMERDDNMRIMVGVENSMNTGLNLQMFSRLIRVETIWNPGTLEQGNSRINRPELKKAETRTKIYFDWIMANHTMDITKISRLISKIIAVAKFENSENLEYETIPDVQIIPMNSESIQSMNDWQANLQEYAEAYKGYKQVQHNDYAEYKAKQTDIKWDANGNLVMEPLAVAPTPKDAQLLPDTPYTPGLELFEAGKFGLVRTDEYLRQDTVDEGEQEADDEGEDDEGEGKEDAANTAKKRFKEACQNLLGKTAHTEFGEGIIKSVGARGKYLNVLFPSGHLVRCKFAASFVVTKPVKDLTAKLKAAVGLPLGKPVGMPGARFRIDNAALRKQAELKQVEQEKKEKEVLHTDISVELTLAVSNGFLGISYFVNTTKKGAAAKSALQALGFRPVPDFALAEMKNAAQLKRQFDAWAAKGFTIDESYRKMNVHGAIYDMYNMLKTGKLAKGSEDFKFASKNQLMNFFRAEVKPSTSKTEFKPFPMIEDGKAYLVMHLRGQPANLRATKVKVAAVTWQHGDPSLVYYGLNLAATGQKIKEIIDSGIEISNVKELKQQFNHLKRVKLREDVTL